MQGSSPGRGWDFFSSIILSRPALGPTLPPFWLLPGALSLGVKLQGREATTYLHLVPRSIMRGAIPPLPTTPSWRGTQFKKSIGTTLPFTFTFRSWQYSFEFWTYTFQISTPVPVGLTWHFCGSSKPYKGRDSSVDTVTGYGLVRGGGVRFPAGTGNFSVLNRVQTGSGAYPTSYPKWTRSSFCGGKSAGTWRWPLTSS
jgi:hypothetical protein